MASKIFSTGCKLFCVTSGSVIVTSIFSSSMSDTKPFYALCEAIFQPFQKWDPNWDKRHFSGLVKPSDNPIEQNKINENKANLVSTATRHVFLIRHGQYETGQESDINRKLTALGRKQADMVGQRLKSLNINYTKLIRSTMTRAQETSEIILKHFPDLPVQNNDLLREGHPIPVEPPIGNWRAEYLYYRDGPRIEGAFRKYFHRASPKQKTDSYEIIVCHANVIRYFVCRLLQVPPEAWLRFSLHHCSITRVTIYPSGNVCVHAIGESGFLPLDQMSTY